MKRILIIGATSAIASACARLWATQGASLFLVGRDAEKLEALADDLSVRGASAVYKYQMDANDIAVHTAMVSAAVTALGAFDIALIAHGTLPDQAACEADAALALCEFTTNGTSVIALLTELANQFEQQRNGAIGVITSVAGDRGRPSNYVYGSAKAAVSVFCEGLRVAPVQSRRHADRHSAGFRGHPHDARVDTTGIAGRATRDSCSPHHRRHRARDRRALCTGVLGLDYVHYSVDPRHRVQTDEIVTMTPAPLTQIEEGVQSLSNWHYRAVLWSVLLAAIGYLGFALWSGWRDVASAVGKVGVLGVGIALSLSLVNYGLRFIRWQAYLRAMDHPVPWWPSLKIYLAGFALTTTPGKAGEALRGVLLRRWGDSLPEELGCIPKRTTVGPVGCRLAHLVWFDCLPGSPAIDRGRLYWGIGGLRHAF